MTGAFLQLGACTVQATRDPHGSSRRFVLLHTNDLHGQIQAWSGWEDDLEGKSIGGMDRIAGAVASARKEFGPDVVILVDAGDAIGDTLIATLTRGQAVIDLMNAIGYDAATLGNHEPDYGSAVIVDLFERARFPLLGANVSLPPELAQPQAWIVREASGIRVGLFGLTYPRTPLTTSPDNVRGWTYRHDTATVVRDGLRDLRGAGAEVIVVLSHLGLGADIDLARQTEGIDVIVGGHSHNRMTEPLRVGKTLIVQAGAHGSDLGQLEVRLDTRGELEHRYRLIAIDAASTPSESSIARLMDRIIAPHRDTLDEPVGHAAGFLVRAQTLAGGTPRERDQQSPVDSLFADIVRTTTGSDVAFLPGVGYGVAIPPGPISAAALRALLPHESKVFTLLLTGQQIIQVLEQSLENVYTDDPASRVGGMIQVSGLRFSYAPDPPKGSRLRSVTVAEQPIEVDRSYRVATNSLLAYGGHNYKTFLDAQQRQQAEDQYQLIKRWFIQNSPVASPIDRRIERARSDAD